MKRRYVVWVVAGILLVALLCVGSEYFNAHRAQGYIVQGLAAYAAGDCDTAREHFADARVYEARTQTQLARSITESYYDEYDLCRDLGGVDRRVDEGLYVEAWLECYDLIQDEPEGLRATMIRERALSVFESVEPAALADEEVCGEVAGILEWGLVPEPAVDGPALYLACGDVFYQLERYGEAGSCYRAVG